MDTARILLSLKQGPQSLDNYIREFLAIAHYSDLPDIILIEFFCDGINQPLQSKLRREGPRSSLSCFLDFALLTVGSLFTVGVAEEERDTASMTEMVAAPERTHKMAATAEPDCKMVDTTVPRHVTAANPESGQDTGHNNVISQLIFMSQVKSQMIFMSLKSWLIFMNQVKSRLIFMNQVKSQLIFMTPEKIVHLVITKHISTT